MNEKIKVLLKLRSLKQEDLAELLHVSQSMVSKWCRAKAVPDAYQARDIARHLDISLENLVDPTYEIDPRDVSASKITARQVFDQVINQIGPVETILRLRGQATPGTPRPVGDYSLGEIVGMTPTSPALSDRKKKRTDTPNSPTGQL